MAIGLLIVDVVFETVGIALAALNSAVANVSSYVSAATLATTVTTLIPMAKTTRSRIAFFRSVISRFASIIYEGKSIKAYALAATTAIEISIMVATTPIMGKYIQNCTMGPAKLK